MLIELHASLRGQLERGAPRRQETIEAMENLAVVRREGKHILFADRATIQYLYQNTALTDKARGVFSRVAEKLPEMRFFARSVHTRVEVVSNAAPNVTVRQEGGQCIINVPAWWFADSSHPQRVVLLSENLLDARCYVQIARAYAVLNGYSRIPVEAELRGGGGGTTGPMYADMQRARERFCLCVVDSDRKAPDGALGTTARGVAAADDPGEPLSHWEMLGVRELENMIPNAMYGRLSAGNRDRMKVVDFLESLQRQPEEDIRRYVDLKNGLTYQQVIDFSPASPEGRFWMPLVPVLQRLGAAVDPNCQSTASCANPTGCTCRLIPSFGEKILEAVLHALEAATPQKIVETLCDQTQHEWMRIGAVLFAWCCGSQRLNAI